MLEGMDSRGDAETRRKAKATEDGEEAPAEARRR